MAKKKSKLSLDVEQLIANENVINSDVTDEIENAMLTYAIKTIIDRAIPDIRDGLKPVHRRSLYGAYIDGLFPNKKYEKNSGVVGTIMKYFHPHGDGSIYDSVVTMSQPWNYRYPLYDFQGNNGSIDGDSPAAMRYTEGKLHKRALTLLGDIDKECVNFRPNYSESTTEPEVLPGLFPNLLCNGASGIATGYTTEIPSHQLGEVVDAIINVIQNPDCTIDDILKHIKGPDYPGGSYLINNEKIKELYTNGKGTLTFKGKCEIEQNEETDNTQVVITQIPPNVNKPKLVEKIHTLCLEEKKIPRVIDVRDESAANEIRIVIELHKTGIPEVVINELYNRTDLQKNSSYIMRVIVNQTPKILNIKEILEFYIEHRKDVVYRRSQYILNKAKDKSHIQEGLNIVTNDIDKAIKIIRNAENDKEAKEQLIKTFSLSDIQANEVLELKLRQLTKLNKNDIINLIKELTAEIKKHEVIMSTQKELEKVIIAELKELKSEYNDTRKTELFVESNVQQIIDTSNNEPIIAILTSKNNIKHIAQTTFDDMFKNGVLKERTELFIQGLKCKIGDAFILILSNGDYIKADFSDLMAGVPITDSKVTIKAMILYDESKNDKAVVAMTKKGLIKKVPMSGFKIKSKKATSFIDLQDDEIIGVKVSYLSDDNVITLATKDGLVHRFFEKSFKETAAGGKGIGGINLQDDNEVVDFDISNQNDDNNNYLIVFTKHDDGKFGLKKIPLTEFKPKGRISQGIKGVDFSKKNGGHVSGLIIESGDFYVLNSKSGIVNFNFNTLPDHNRYNKPEIIKDEITVKKFFLE